MAQGSSETNSNAAAHYRAIIETKRPLGLKPVGFSPSTEIANSLIRLLCSKKILSLV